MSIAPTTQNLCGICEHKIRTDNEKQLWFTNKNHYAHKSCLDKIKSVEEDLLKEINRGVSGKNPRTEKEYAALVPLLVESQKFVRSKVRLLCEKPLLSFLNERGVDALKNLYSITVPHIRQFWSR